MSTLLEDMKMAVRVSHSATDAEIQMWVDAALADMVRAGVRPELAKVKEGVLKNPLAKAAVACYVKANYGYDVDERPQFEESYRRIVCDLLNSDANVAAGENDG